jgi:hypothetical protein
MHSKTIVIVCEKSGRLLFVDSFICNYASTRN